MNEPKKKPGPKPERPGQLLEWLRNNAQPVTVQAVVVPSITELVELTGMPRRSLEVALRGLTEAGKVRVERRTSRTGPVRLEVV